MGKRSVVVKFPTNRVTEGRWIIQPSGPNQEVETLDHAIRSCRRAIEALRRQEASLSMRIRAAVRRHWDEIERDGGANG